jgi:thiamine pyrophosphate-dependent acetolactate synthase large subunit-like protein
MRRNQSYVAVPKLKLDRITAAAELIRLKKTYDCLWSRNYSWSAEALLKEFVKVRYSTAWTILGLSALTHHIVGMLGMHGNIWTNI